MRVGSRKSQYDKFDGLFGQVIHPLEVGTIRIEQGRKRECLIRMSRKGNGKERLVVLLRDVN